MKKYFLTKTPQENGDHILHAVTCRELPAEDTLLYLGFFKTFSIALEQAKKMYADVGGNIVACDTCSTMLFE